MNTAPCYILPCYNYFDNFSIVESCTEIKCPYLSYKSKNCECMCPDPMEKLPAVPCNDVGKRKVKSESLDGESQSLNVDIRLNNIPAKTTFANTLQLQGTNTGRNTAGSTNIGTGNPLSVPSNDISLRIAPFNDLSKTLTIKNDLSMLLEVNDPKSISETAIEAAKFAIGQNNYKHGRVFYI